MPLFESLRWRVNTSCDLNGASTSTAIVKIKINDQIVHTADEGVGQVDALTKALKKAVVAFYPEIGKIVLSEYAKVRVIIEMRKGEDHVIKVSSSEDVLKASWNALVEGLNELVETAS